MGTGVRGFEKKFSLLSIYTRISDTLGAKSYIIVFHADVIGVISELRARVLIFRQPTFRKYSSKIFSRVSLVILSPESSGLTIRSGGIDLAAEPKFKFLLI